MQTIQSKLPSVSTTIFTVMSQLAAEHQALNLSQGFPDFDCPDFLKDKVEQHMRAGLNQYAPMTGLPKLRQAIADKTQRAYQRSIDPELEITVTSGATEALFAIIQALVNQGDEVIIFDPAYDSYDPAICLAGGVPVHLALNSDYSINFESLLHVISTKTRAIIINSPHNPTGSILDAESMLQLQSLVVEKDLLLISDEVYEHIIFDDEQHQSVNLYPELAARSAIVSSFGKTFHCTGWKVGYVVAPANLTKEIRKVHQYLTFSTATPLQAAIADMLCEHPEHWQQLPAFYQQKRDCLREALSGSRFDILPCKGTYFQLLKYQAISDLPDTEFCRWMTEQHKVASIPISVFYQQSHDQYLIRLCFAKSEQTLHQGSQNIMRNLNVCCVQFAPEWEAPRQNLSRLENLLQQESAADVIILPEMFTTGFSIKNANCSDAADESIKWMQMQSKKHDAAIVGSLKILEDDAVYNRLYWVNPDGNLYRYNKRHLFGAESESIRAGTERKVFEFRGWRFLPQICYDLRFPAFSRNRNDYDVLLYVASWPKVRIAHWNALLTARAIENLSYAVGVNRIGSDGNGWEYPGETQALSPRGELIAKAAQNQEELIRFELDHQLLTDTRTQLNYLKDCDSFHLQLDK